jgi:hypothetical protein
MGWVYVRNDGSGPVVIRASDPSITVGQVQPGQYIITFGQEVAELTCVATVNNSVGTITAVPGDNAGLSANQVSVLTLGLDNSFQGSLDFTVAPHLPVVTHLHPLQGMGPSPSAQGGDSI